jgi:hypothetical protein
MTPPYNAFVADIWSLGVVLAEIGTKYRLRDMEGSNGGQSVPPVPDLLARVEPEPLRSVISRCLVSADARTDAATARDTFGVSPSDVPSEMRVRRGRLLGRGAFGAVYRYVGLIFCFFVLFVWLWCRAPQF